VAVAPDDPEAFCTALSGLIDDPAGRGAMGSRGRAWVERWISPAAVAQAYEELFEEVAGHRPPRARRMSRVDSALPIRQPAR
jgi:glycosyltransferase involved in cell wall biosynthesis